MPHLGHTESMNLMKENPGKTEEKKQVGITQKKTSPLIKGPSRNNPQGEHSGHSRRSSAIWNSSDVKGKSWSHISQ
jgi:hypothetical protein